MDVDVIVAGSGPSGAAAATVLAQNGVNVLLVDKAQFPRTKVCGDGLPPLALELLNEIGVKDKLLETEPNEITKVKIVSPKNRSVTLNIKLKNKFYIIPRLTMDKVLHDHAIESGARFIQAWVKAPILKNGVVVGLSVMENGEEKQYYAKLVIAADGNSSKIASALRRDIQQHHHQIISLRGYLKGYDITNEMNEGYLLPELVPGYLWVFPTGDGRINIGLGMRRDKYSEKKTNLKKILERFLKRPEIKARLSQNWELGEMMGATMNLASQENIRRAYNGALLVGDAGAWIAPLTGGGIYNAIFSGKTAAEVATEAITKNDTSLHVLRHYETRCLDHMWREIRLTYNIQRLIARHPFLIEASLKLVNKKLLNLLRLYEDVDF